ncbi:hypothetical protein JOF28_000152 [Leucobacter exalbidus]|uniref:Uncharacterized protein n=1 Tax=Leucobacter exalbidus TaxID=662960 RepID=A0A940PRJ1_9MICO|nr:hypothetical protein [Leucobacter exalbidus]MBP1324920.1 hypothetical protein [Leucobacter exalbidus]
MNRHELAAARKIWRARRPVSAGDRAHTVYAAVLLTVICVVPLARALWLGASSPAGVALITAGVAPDAYLAAASMLALLCTGALLLGRIRGPAFLPPFLVHAWGTSPHSKMTIFRRRIIATSIIAGATGAGLALCLGAMLLGHGAITLAGVAWLVSGALCAGLSLPLVWLGGQAFPVAVPFVALGLLGGVVLSTAFPGTAAIAVNGWSAPVVVISMAACALLLYAILPALLNRLTLHDLAHQSAQWATATALIYSFDLPAVSTLYQRNPRLGRHMRAVRLSTHLTWVFFVRDAVGAMRTPGRLLMALTATATAGALLAAPVILGMPAWVMPMTAALLLYAASRVLAQGLIYAADAVSDMPLFGVSDARLIAYHALFPLVTLVGTLITTATLCPVVGSVVGTVAGSASPLYSLASAVFLCGAVLGVRVATSLRGHLPPLLLTPIGSPVGDLSIVTWVIWVGFDLALVLVSGWAAALLPQAPLIAAVVGAAVAALIAARWRSRR